ncbi:penicillin-binding transpeptidase domain-containing protein [Halomonas denitrificans]|nr:hypothetical protein [Halomonas denitrificans]
MTERGARCVFRTLALALLAAPWAAAAPAEEPVRLPFEDPAREVVFLAMDLETGARWTVAPEAIDARRAPYSTFKIPNLLIALDVGAAESLEHRIVWDPERRPAEDHWPAGWAQSQTLASAFRRSAVWYFRDLALAIGGATYRERLDAFDYGNAVAADGSDRFWLDGTLAISVREQVDFLARLVRGELPVDPGSVEALREVARLDERSGHVLFGKTGAGPAVDGEFDGPFRGWLVGWIERPERAPVTFALFATAPDWASIARFRRQAAERLLGEAGVWPEAP